MESGTKDERQQAFRSWAAAVGAPPSPVLATREPTKTAGPAAQRAASALVGALGSQRSEQRVARLARLLEDLQSASELDSNDVGKGVCVG